MTRAELIQNTQEYMSSSHGVTVEINPREIDNRINDAKRWFRINYENAVEQRYYVIPNSIFHDESFKEKRDIKMPRCVVSIAECKEVRAGLQYGFNDRDFSINKLFAADIFMGNFASDDLVTRTAYMNYYDLARAFLKQNIRYSYNYNTNNLTILGGDARTDIFVRAYVEIPEESLFEDDYFIRWLRGECLLSFGRMTTMFQNNLAGGVTMGTEYLKSEGKEMKKEVEADIEKRQNNAYFEIFR